MGTDGLFESIGGGIGHLLHGHGAWASAIKLLSARKVLGLDRLPRCSSTCRAIHSLRCGTQLVLRVDRSCTNGRDVALALPQKVVYVVSVAVHLACRHGSPSEGRALRASTATALMRANDKKNRDPCRTVR